MPAHRFFKHDPSAEFLKQFAPKPNRENGQYMIPHKASSRYRVLTYLVKGPCHTGAKLPWSHVWKRIKNTLTDIGHSRTTMYEIIDWLKETGAFIFDKKGREIFIKLKKRYLPERTEKKSGSTYIGAKAKDSYSKSRILSKKMDKLSWFLAQSFGEHHYDNCKVAHLPKITANAIKRLLQIGVSRKQIKAFYAAAIERFHQMANDKGEKFMPTGIAAFLNSWNGKSSLSDTLESFFGRFDISSDQLSSKTPYTESYNQIAPKGQEGGYYSTMEEFYAQQTQQKQIQESQAETIPSDEQEQDEDEQPNLIAGFMQKHHIAKFGANPKGEPIEKAEEQPEQENLIAKFLKQRKLKKQQRVKVKRAPVEPLTQISKLLHNLKNNSLKP